MLCVVNFNLDTGFDTIEVKRYMQSKSSGNKNETKA